MYVHRAVEGCRVGRERVKVGAVRLVKAMRTRLPPPYLSLGADLIGGEIQILSFINN
jgi:hypothetical protein